MTKRGLSWECKAFSVWKSINIIHHINSLQRKSMWSYQLMHKKFFKTKLNIDSWLKACNRLGIEGNFPPPDSIYKSLDCVKTTEDCLDPRPHCLTTAFFAVGWSCSKIPGNTVPTMTLVSSDNPEASSWWKQKSNQSELCVLYGVTITWGTHAGCLTMTITLCGSSMVERPWAWWRRSLLIKDRGSENKAVWWEAGSLSELGVPPGNQKWQSASFRKTAGTWRWDFWKSESSWQLSQTKLEWEPLAISTKQQSSKKELTKETTENFFFFLMKGLAKSFA